MVPTVKLSTVNGRTFLAVKVSLMMLSLHSYCHPSNSYIKHFSYDSNF